VGLQLGKLGSNPLESHMQVRVSPKLGAIDCPNSDGSIPRGSRARASAATVDLALDLEQFQTRCICVIMVLELDENLFSEAVDSVSPPQFQYAGFFMTVGSWMPACGDWEELCASCWL
jgi:hypothetical protein